ncbi:RidA family protein [Zunongwangia profunda]|uniref:RidA family protein n=1 Tax=Zunongwangia profunda TaxID=398743 RepID=UPI000C94DB5E|nr:RidA family protein [Zunongwangia profunda]MAG87527.1 hypothetical protein [Flavobacteriaceae bacterium]MCC4227176.1 RidA family protein [Zunongwangia profunda]
MEKRVINPWEWQKKRSYVQAVEVKKAEATLYIAGQTGIDENGNSSTGNMKSELLQSIQNLEKIIAEAGYECRNIVRLNIYTTASEEFFECFDLFEQWIKKHHIQQASTVFEVKSLFETLKIELEATLVK